MGRPETETFNDSEIHSATTSSETLFGEGTIQGKLRTRGTQTVCDRQNLSVREIGPGSKKFENLDRTGLREKNLENLGPDWTRTNRILKFCSHLQWKI